MEIEHVRMDLPYAAGAARAARAAVRASLPTAERSPAHLAEVELVMTELIENAVMHGEPPVRVVVTETSTGVHIEVSDGCSRRPPVPPTGRGRPGGGRGLVIVDRLSSRWGVRPGSPGKCVWATCNVAPS